MKHREGGGGRKTGYERREGGEWYRYETEREGERYGWNTGMRMEECTERKKLGRERKEA